MKLTKVIGALAIAGGLLFAGGTSIAVADSSITAIPVDANMTPKSQTKIGTSATFTKKLSWAGGISNFYNVTYSDDRKELFYDPRANYYSTSVSGTYSRGSLTQKTWGTRLIVRNGTTATATGSVTLKAR